MITKEEIQNLLSLDKATFESDSLEFKSATEISSGFLETVSAFSFSTGGNIVLGIHQKEDRSLHYIGVQAAESQELKVVDLLKNEMTNLLETDYRISIINIDNKDLPVIVVSVNKIEDIRRRPAFITKRGIDNGSFMRVGQGDKKIPKYWLENIRKEQSRLEGKEPYPELKTVSAASIKDLNLELVKKYADNLNYGVTSGNLDGANLHNFLSAKNIINDQTPTKFGLLFFCDYPEKFLCHQATIQVSDESYVDVLNGEMGKNKELYEGRIDTILTNTLQWISKNLSKTRKVNKDGSTTEELVIPPKIIREIVVNAFCHRDYEESEKIFLKIKNDYLTIENPGILNYKIYNKNYIIPGKTNHPNPNIAKYLYKISGIAEGEGKGFTALLQFCLDQQIDIPRIELDFAGRVKIEVSNNRLMNKEVEVWLDTKKYFIKVSINSIDKIILAYLYKSHHLINDGLFAINLSPECLSVEQKTSVEKLKKNNLICEELVGSTKIYKLHPELLRNDYSSELITLFGEDFINLDGQSKEILSLAMQFEKNSTPFSARKITGLLYPNSLEISLLHDIERKVRNKCSYLEKKMFLKRDVSTKLTSPSGSLRLNFSRSKNNIKKIEKSEIASGPVQGTLI